MVQIRVIVMTVGSSWESYEVRSEGQMTVRTFPLRYIMDNDMNMDIITA